MKYLLLLSISLCTTSLFAQHITTTVEYIVDNTTANDTLISYTPNKKLTWDDFQGTTEDKSEIAALTMSGFGYKMGYSSMGNNANLTISISCNFVKHDSWVKPGKNTAYILTHEQHHFDIAYIQTKLFQKRLKEMKFTGKGFAQAIEDTYREYKTALATMQDEYDTETKHSQITDKQELWNKKIEELVVTVNGEL